MVEQIAEATTGKVMNFTYGTNNQRLKMDYLLNSQNQYTRYYAENYDKQISTTETKQWNYIYTPSGLSAVYYVNNGTGQLLYTLTDHLGSPILLTNTAGQVVEEYSFDAWGRQRNPTDWTYTATEPNILIRGYTGHEHLSPFGGAGGGLINMNARLYDPVIGRFIQPDNYIQAPDFLQNFNRFSYVFNNPLKYTDPSGNGGSTPEENGDKFPTRGRKRGGLNDYTPIGLDDFFLPDNSSLGTWGSGEGFPAPTGGGFGGGAGFGHAGGGGGGGVGLDWVGKGVGVIILQVETGIFGVWAQFHIKEMH